MVGAGSNSEEEHSASLRSSEDAFSIKDATGEGGRASINVS